MKPLSCFVILIALFSYTKTEAKDYFQYHELVNSLDEHIILERYSDAIPVLDSIYRNFNFIYARHSIKALQICLRVRDEERSSLWLQKSILGGVPLWYLKHLPSIRSIQEFEKCRIVLSNYDSLHQVYLKRINRKLADYIDSLFEIDQIRTNRVNDGIIPLRYTVYGLQWLHNNKKQWKLIQQVMTTYGFPGEQLIGLPKYYEDTSIAYRNGIIRFTQLDAYQVYFMLLHCYSHKEKSMNEQLIQAVKSGMMPAYQYAAINDFMAEYGYKSYRQFYYNEWQTDDDSTHLAQINIRRKSIGLNSYEASLRNDQLNLEKRKRKTYYQDVFLE